MKIHSLLLGTAFMASALSVAAQDNTITVQTKKIGAEIQPTMYGIFFEDINFGADGGLYAELVKNRSFEFTPDHYMGWKMFGNVTLQNDGPFEKNPHYVRLGCAGHGDMWTGIQNEGFFGIGLKKDAEYRFSVWARVPDGNPVTLMVQFIDQNTMNDAQQFVSQDLKIDSKEWKKYTMVMKSNRTIAKANLRIFLSNDQHRSGTGTVDLEHVSLFPVDTWMGHENGMRKDLAQALYDMRPGVFRFPGGCIVEGTNMETRYQWKNTVGPVENRPLNKNRWESTFINRYYPDYFQSYGLGFFEFFQLSEEIGAEPLPVLSCGLSCQFQNSDAEAHVAVCDLDSYVQDALDLIEFANGDVTTKWGKLRADMGHPAPFNLKFIGIGNEQWGPEYPEHLEPFIKAIRKAYPDIKIIGSSGPDSEGKQFEYLWPEMKRLKVDLVDEHFYRPENWFLNQGTRYDNYDRKGPKVFAGEYACHGKGKKWNHFNAALLEAAFMTGLERNADIVHMATYAPLFAHVEGWQWRPDMIWFDNHQVYGSVNYYVQSMFMRHQGTHRLDFTVTEPELEQTARLLAEQKGTNVLSLTMDKKPVAGTEGQNGLFASAVYDKDKKEIIVKVANTSDKAQPLSLKFEGLKKQDVLSDGRCIKLRSTDSNKIIRLNSHLLFSPRKFRFLLTDRYWR